VVGVCTVTDVRWHKIYNWVTYPAFLWAVLFSAAGAWLLPAQWQARLGTVGPGDSLLGALIGFVGVLIAYHLSGGGAGDVKLATALGAWLGVQNTVHLLVYTYAVGAVVLLSWTIWQQGPITVFGGLLRSAGATLFPRWVAPPSEQQAAPFRRGVPMSPFFAAAAVAVLPGWIPS
jgi:prepilin peptidase CpaA